MLVLDTDHLTEYQRGTSPEAHRLKYRLDRATEPYATSIITVEEIMLASIALANNATLLSRNSCDFERVPGLHVEDWLS